MEPVNSRRLEELLEHLARFRRRLRVRDGWLLIQRSLWIALAVAGAVQVIGRLFPVENLLYWTLAPLAVWAVALTVYILFRPLRPERVARHVDVELGLKERLGTALVLSARGATSGAKNSTSQPVFPSDLVELQFADALAAAQTIRPRQAFPLLLLRRPVLAAVMLGAAVASMALLPNPMDDILKERAAIAQEAEQQAERIEELMEEVEASEELSPEMKEELLRQLAELAEQLRANSGDRADALADLARVEEALRERMDPTAGMRQAALEALAAQLQALAQREGSSPDDLSKMDEDLAKLAEELANMSETERQQLAQTLSQMAQRAAQAGEMDLANALASMAQAAQAGDSQAASQAASRASEAASQSQRELSEQEALERALSQMQASRQRMAQAGQGRQAAQSGQGQQGESNGEGQGQGQGQGQNPGQNQGQGQGQGQGQQAGGGGGSSANTLPPGTRPGQAGAPEGEGREGSLGDPSQQVYVPWERSPNSGDEVFIPGQDTGQGETQTREQRDPLPGTLNPALMPYYDVFNTYLDAANQSMDQSYIPSGLKSYVREYFSQLEP